MFKELGYKKEENRDYIIYKSKEDKDGFYQTVIFDKFNKNYKTDCCDELDICGLFITRMDLHKAINKQVEGLGWL